MPRILLVEDETAIAQTLQYALRAEGFESVHCLTGGEALRLMAAENFDLAVLDIGLPDIGGFALCRELRRNSAMPVIFLTAQGAEADRILGLEIGADDYVTKPYSPREVVARVKAVLRRGRASIPTESGTEAFDHDVAGKCIRFRGRLLDLTRYEFGLLAALLQRSGAILSRAQLMDRVWGDALDSGDRTVDTHIKTLRAKLREVDPAADPIRTRRGLGYSLEVERPGPAR